MTRVDRFRQSTPSTPTVRERRVMGARDSIRKLLLDSDNVRTLPDKFEFAFFAGVAMSLSRMKHQYDNAAIDVLNNLERLATMAEFPAIPVELAQAGRKLVQKCGENPDKMPCATRIGWFFNAGVALAAQSKGDDSIMRAFTGQAANGDR